MKTKTKKELTKVEKEKKQNKSILLVKIFTACAFILSIISLLVSCSVSYVVNENNNANISEINRKNQLSAAVNDNDTFFEKYEKVNEHLHFDKYLLDTTSHTSLMNALYNYVSNNDNTHNLYELDMYSLINNINESIYFNNIVKDTSSMQLHFYRDDNLVYRLPYQSDMTAPYLDDCSLRFIHDANNVSYYPYNRDLMLHIKNAYYYVDWDNDYNANSQPVTYYMPPYIPINGDQLDFVINCRFDLNGVGYYDLNYVFNTYILMSDNTGNASTDLYFEIQSYDYNNNVYYYGLTPNSRTIDNNSWVADNTSYTNGRLTNVALTKKSVVFFDTYFQYEQRYYTNNYVINNNIYNQVLTNWNNLDSDYDNAYKTIYNKIINRPDEKILIREGSLDSSIGVFVFGGLTYHDIEMYATYKEPNEDLLYNIVLEIEIVNNNTNQRALISGVVYEWHFMDPRPYNIYYITNSANIITLKNVDLSFSKEFNLIYDLFEPYTNQDSKPPFIDDDGNVTEQGYDHLFVRVFKLINHAISSIISLLSIPLFGEYTIGVFLLVPLMITLLLFIVRLFKR